MSGFSIEADLGCKILQEIIHMIEDIKEQGGYVNVRSQGKTSPIYCQDNARCTVI